MSKPLSDSDIKPSAIVLAPEAPYPVIGGGPLRTASVIEYLRNGYTVEVITFREPGAPNPTKHFPGDVRVSVIDLPYHRKDKVFRAVRNVRRALEGVPPLVDRFAGFGAAIGQIVGGRKFDVGIIEHFWCAPYAASLRRCCDRLIINLHNVESVLLARQASCSGAAPALILRRFAARCKNLEHRWLPEFDDILVASDTDSTRLNRSCVVYPNAVPWVPPPRSEKQCLIVFSGNLEYQPNQTAVAWFHKKVWPELRQTCPSLRWLIVGRNEHAIRTTLEGDERIELTGQVPNAVEAIARARIAIAPLLTGSGTRVKIIEAWAAGLPVVSTTLGAEGLPCINGEHVILADSPTQFADAVRRILCSPELESHLSSGGRKLFQEQLTWEVAWRSLTHCGI